MTRELLLDPGGTALQSTPRDGLPDVLQAAPTIAAELLGGGPEDRADAPIVFRNVAGVAALAARDDDAVLFEQAVQSFAGMWKLGDPAAMYPTRTPDREASLWENLAIELYALGGVTVRHARWSLLVELVRQNPSDTHRQSWLRQGQTASARAATDEESFLGLVARRLRELDPTLRPSDEAAIAAACQFDLLSALVITETDPNGFYPNAAEFSENLVEPLVVDELRQRRLPLAEHLFPGDAAALREGLANYDRLARIQAALMRRAGRDWKWRGFADARTLVFIDQGHLLEEWEGQGGWSEG